MRQSGSGKTGGEWAVYIVALCEILLKLNTLFDIIGISMKKSEFREFDNTL